MNKETQMCITRQSNGEYWLNISAPSGKNAGINLGKRNGKGIVDSVIREVSGTKTQETAYILPMPIIEVVGC